MKIDLLNSDFPKFKIGKSLLVDVQKIMDFNSLVWKTKKDNGKTLRDEIKIKIPKDLKNYEKDLIAMHNIV
jgi:valyl-tRNA synthetase